MNELRHDSLIGGDESFAVIWIPDSNLDIMKQSAKTLNSSSVYETFIKEFGD